MLNKFAPCRVLLLAVPLSLLALSVAHAQNEDATALRSELSDLKRTVESLNTKIESLERRLADQHEPAVQEAGGVTTPPSDTAPTAVPGTRPQERWARISRGMTFQQVDALLGRPQRTIDLSPKTVWYYAYPDIGNASVVFQEGEVSDWQAPPFNTWW
jgi:SmpA/OmlA family protein